MYLDAYDKGEVRYSYFSKDGYPTILNFGGTAVSIVYEDKFMDQLPRSTMTVFNDQQEIQVTDMLEEFFICKTSDDGVIKVYYETYNFYDSAETEEKLNVYVNLKAYEITFKAYSSDELEEFLEDFTTV